MAEYLIQDTTLDAIADAINAKTGDSSALTPAEMVSAIGSISGGGLPSDVTAIAAGTYTPASDTAGHTFTHNLGCYPTAFYVGIMQNQDLSIDHFLFAAAVGYSSTGSMVCNIREQTTNTTGAANRATNTVSGVTNNSITINRTSSSQGQYKAGVTYFWFAVATASSYVAP